MGGERLSDPETWLPTLESVRDSIGQFATGLAMHMVIDGYPSTRVYPSEAAEDYAIEETETRLTVSEQAKLVASLYDQLIEDILRA